MSSWNQEVCLTVLRIQKKIGSEVRSLSNNDFKDYWYQRREVIYDVHVLYMTC